MVFFSHWIASIDSAFWYIHVAEIIFPFPWDEHLFEPKWIDPLPPKEWFLQAMAVWHPWAPAKLLLEVWQPRSLQDRIEQFASAGIGWVPYGIWQTLWKDGGRRRFRVRTSWYRSRSGATWCRFGETSSRVLQDKIVLSFINQTGNSFIMKVSWWWGCKPSSCFNWGAHQIMPDTSLSVFVDWFLAFD